MTSVAASVDGAELGHPGIRSDAGHVRHRLLTGLIASALATAFVSGSAIAWVSAESPIPLPTDLAAQEAIVEYEVLVRVQADASMLVDELITYNAGTVAERHGLVRELVTEDTLEDGMRRAYGVELASITQDGSSAQVSVDESPGLLTIRIGDEDVPITGLHTYGISYRVSEPLDVNDAGDVELYWDFVGNQWRLPIYRSEVTILGRAPAIAAECFQAITYENGCQVKLNDGPDGATVLAASGDSSPEAGGYLTGAIAWPASAFTATPQPEILEPEQVIEDRRAGQVLPWAIGLAVLAIVVPIGFALMLGHRQARRIRSRAPVRYEPPEGLRPAEIEAGLTGTVTSRGVAATVLDLAARGHVRVIQHGKGHGNDGGITLVRSGPGRDSLSMWEGFLVEGIFAGQPSVRIEEDDPRLIGPIGVASALLISDATASGRFRPRAPKRRVGFMLLGAVGVVAFFAWIGIIVFSGPAAFPTTATVALAIPAVGFVVGAIVGAQLMPARPTSSATAFQVEVEGFRRFMDSDSADTRREFAEGRHLSSGALFATYLPYAVALGMEDTWVDDFPDLAVAALTDFGLLVPSLGDLRTLHSTLAAPSLASSSGRGSSTRSSGSGFSSSASGGGGGGGGGGGSF